MLAPGEGERYSPPGHPDVVLKAGPAATLGAYSLLEFTVVGNGPAMHVHHDAEEAFYVLDGEITIRMGADSIQAIAGSFVLIPRETPHTFDNASDHPSRMLTIFSPPGFEQFFPQVAALTEPAGSPAFLAAVESIRHSLNTELVSLDS